jgi:hypothetical protein
VLKPTFLAFREFVECAEQVTIWGNAYETSVAKSEGSSCGDINGTSSSSHKLSSNFEHVEIVEKENVVYTDAPSAKLEEQASLRNNSTSSENLSSARSSVEFTIFVDPSEQKRMKKYGVEDLNLTNVLGESSSVINRNLLNYANNKLQQASVLSPRKMIFHNDTVSVTIQDKVLLDPLRQKEENTSISVEQDERFELRDKSNVQTKPLLSKKSITEAEKLVAPEVHSFTTPKIFTSKPVTTTSFHSPPVYNPEPMQDLDDVFKMITSDTPSKNLCCIIKNCTPKRSEKKILFTAPRPNTVPRKSINLLEEFENIEKDKVSQSARKTIFLNEPINNNICKIKNRHTTFEPVAMQTTNDEVPNKRLPRKTILFDDLPVQPISENEKPPFERELNTTDSREKSNNLSIDGAGNMTNSRMLYMLRPTEQYQMHSKNVSRKSVITNESMQLDDTSSRDDTERNSLNEFEMIEENTARMQTPRKTIYRNESMHIDDSWKNESTTAGTTSTDTLNAKTSMQITTYENAQPPSFGPPQQSRQTIVFNDSIQPERESTNVNTSYKPHDLDKDEDDVADEELHDPTVNFQIYVRNQSRKSVITNDSMQLEGVAETIRAHIPKNSVQIDKDYEGMTIFESESMQVTRDSMHLEEDMTNATYHETPSPKNRATSSRKTILNNESIILDNNQVAQLSAKSQRKTVIDASMNEDLEQLTIENTRKNRKTLLYNDSMCVESDHDVKIQKTHKDHCQHEPHVIVDSQQKVSLLLEQFDDGKSMETDPIQMSTSTRNGRKTMIQNEPIHIDGNSDAKLQRINSNYRQTVYDHQEMVTENHALYNETITDVIEIESNPPTNSDIVSIHQTFAENVPMDKEEVTEPDVLRNASCLRNLSYRPTQIGSQSIEFDRRRTYTKDESNRWHDITDKEMVAMIDDESNPCLNSVENSEPRVQTFESAMEDFVNLTIAESPLNNTTFMRRRSLLQKSLRRQSRVPSPVKDYGTMFDNLTADLKKKDTPKPRLEIDDYLDKLQIGHVKIPRYQLNDSNYFSQKVREIIDAPRESSKLNGNLEVAQFPLIPSAKFLMENLIDR